VAQLKDYLGELAPSLEPSLLEHVKEQVRVVIAHLVGGEGFPVFGEPAFERAFVGIRGVEDEPYQYMAEDVQIIIEVQDDAEQPGLKAILGLILGAEPNTMSAHLWRSEQRVAVVPVDDLGNFAIPALERGSYELILNGPESEIHIQELQIGRK
jgi:hypothetical protein